MAIVSWTLSFLQPYRGRVVAVLALSIGEIGLAALAPWPLKVVVDYVLGGLPLPEPLAVIMPALATQSTVALLVFVVLVGLLVQIASELVRMIHTQMQVQTAHHVLYTLRAKLLTHLQALPLRHHVLTPTADSVYRLDADTHCVDDLIIGGVFPLTLASLNLVVMFVILLYVDLTLALLSLAVAPFLYACLYYYSRTMVDRADRVKALEATLIGRAFEILSSIAAVKSFTRERHELERFSHRGNETMRARLTLTWQESLFSVAVTIITLAGTALVLIVGGLHVLNGTLTLGSLLVVIAYLAAVYDPMSAIAHSTGLLQQAIASARRISEIFELTPEVPTYPDALDASTIKGHLRFERVSFSYDNNSPVLDGVNFDAHPGEMVALVGLTGTGKTTIANLIPRLFEPCAGRILIDDIEVSRYSLVSLRKQIALVPQEPVLFSGTIADNIRYGRLDASDSEVEASARSAHVHDFVERLPNGYQTLVVESGRTLSGGERQRIGIARALLKEAPILILDEPTSAVDAISEQVIFDALRRLRPSHTTLVIAHRLSTIRDATRILVLHEGQLVAQGTHRELLVSSHIYQRMCTRLSVDQTIQETDTVDELLRATL